MVTIHAISGRTLALGREGENLARQVVFDISEWRASYGDGTVSLIAQRHGDAEPYPCNITVDGDTVTWPITSADTACPDYGHCELRYSVGDVLVKSEMWRTFVADALGTPQPEPPEPQQAWVDKVLEAGQAAVDASVNSPKIGDNGNWFVWDFEAGAYVDTGVAASGGGGGAVSSVNGKTGAVELVAEDVGAVPVPETTSVGQTIIVKAVDDSGKPTEWEAVDMPSGCGSSLPATGTEDAGKVLTVTEAGVPGWMADGYELILDETLEEEASIHEFYLPKKCRNILMFVKLGVGGKQNDIRFTVFDDFFVTIKTPYFYLHVVSLGDSIKRIDSFAQTEIALNYGSGSATRFLKLAVPMKATDYIRSYYPFGTGAEVKIWGR